MGKKLYDEEPKDWLPEGHYVPWLNRWSLLVYSYGKLILFICWALLVFCYSFIFGLFTPKLSSRLLEALEPKIDQELIDLKANYIRLSKPKPKP